MYKKKGNKKKGVFNTQVIDFLVEVYGLSESFIRQAVKEEKSSLTAIAVRRDYERLHAPTVEAIEEYREELLQNLKG